MPWIPQLLSQHHLESTSLHLVSPHPGKYFSEKQKVLMYYKVKEILHKARTSFQSSRQPEISFGKYSGVFFIKALLLHVLPQKKQTIKSSSESTDNGRNWQYFLYIFKFIIFLIMSFCHKGTKTRGLFLKHSYKSRFRTVFQFTPKLKDKLTYFIKIKSDLGKCR